MVNILLNILIHIVVFRREEKGAAKVIDTSDKIAKRNALATHFHKDKNYVSVVCYHRYTKKRPETNVTSLFFYSLEKKLSQCNLTLC